MFRFHTVLLVGIFSCYSLVASAQTTKTPPKTSSFRERPAPRTETKTSDSTTKTEKGRVSFGLNWIFNFSANTNELDDGSDATDDTSFLRLEPQFEFYVTPEVPITLSAGWLRRSLNRVDDQTAASNELLLLLGTGYHLPVNQLFTLIGSAAIGGYFGSSSRLITIQNTLRDEKTDTVGFGGNATLGAGLNFSDHGQFRAGVTYTGLVGSESVADGKSFSVVTHNVALNVGLFYNF